MLCQIQKSMLRLTLHLHVASDAQSINFWLAQKMFVNSFNKFPPFVGANIISNAPTDKFSECQFTSRQLIRHTI